MAESLTHPVFGELRWEAQYSWWFAQMLLPSGEWLDVIVDPGDDDPAAFLERAAGLFPRAMDAERRIRGEAVKMKVLDLYEHWRREDEPQLTAAQLEEKLDLTFVRLDTVAPVIMSYVLDDLCGGQSVLDDVFGGHSVDVEVDEKLQVASVHLSG
jgi:hypothetical protein